METTRHFDCKVIHIPNVEWSPPRACNIGIRRAEGDTIIKIDADLILEPEALEDTLQYTKHHVFVIRQPLYLPEELDLSSLRFPRDYNKLRTLKTHYQLPSYGGFFAVNRDWWHKIRGYDERYVWYGCNDWDLWQRGLRSGLRRIIFGKEGLKKMMGITDYKENSKVYHQWHEKPWKRLKISRDKFDAYKKRNRKIYNEANNILRNTEEWGRIK
jgi:glycosyltransferase involved in cell wall biosynthesis